MALLLTERWVTKDVLRIQQTQYSRVRSDIISQVVEHAGYQRAIISRNPLLVDEDGYDLDSEDDDEHIQEVEAAAAEENPYSSIHLERMFSTLQNLCRCFC